MPNGTQKGTCRSLKRDSSNNEDRALSVRLAITLLLDHGRDWSSLPEIVELIGPKNAIKLVIAFGGLTLKIPPFGRILQAFNESSAAMAVSKGKTIREVSKTHGVPEDNVRRVYEALLANRKAHRNIASRANKQDDLDYMYELTNGV